MKTLNIQFIHTRHWQGLWCIALMCFAGLLIIYATRYHTLYTKEQSTQVLINQLGKQAAPIPVQPKPVDPRSANVQLVASTLQNDLNRVFTLVEAVKEPNARLRNLSLDTPSNTLRLEYELDSMARASSVTVLLNAGYPEGPWRLESVNAAAANNAAASFTPVAAPGAPSAVPSSAPNPGQFRALWSAHTAKL